MLVRERQKKLTNVCTVTLKKFNRKYEIAVYPNKLFEYRHDQTVPLTSIMHTPQIYRSVTAGDIASEQDLALFGLPREEIIGQILQNGHEQKAQATSQYELENAEKQIVDMVQNKVTYNGSYVQGDVLLKFIRRVWDVRPTDVKKQMSGIIRKLEEIGFERISYKVRCSIDEAGAAELEAHGAQFVDGHVIVKSDVLPELVAYCDSNSIAYVIMRNEEVESEEIC